MPRLPSTCLRHARSINSLLPLLLRAVRELPLARNELRWLREHVAKLRPTGTAGHEKMLQRLCLDRSRGKPLQYILGSQPFGDLEVLCEPGVLIPRLETEGYITFLGNSLVNCTTTKKRTKLRILDLCTGTGCIPLLLHSILSPHFPDLALLGIDISSRALHLAKRNLEWNTKQGHLPPSAKNQVQFQHGDILDPKWQMDHNFDIVVSNPPYISPADYARQTERSVRNFEPKLALVPPQLPRLAGIIHAKEDEGDVFYPRILDIAKTCRAKMVLMEVDGAEQAQRVLAIAEHRPPWGECQIWRDGLVEDDWRYGGQEGTKSRRSNAYAQIIGQGRERAVFITQKGFCRS